MGKSEAQKIALIGSGYVGSALLKSWQSPLLQFVVTTTSKEKKEKLEASGICAVQVYGNDAEALSSLLEDKDAVIVTVAPSDSASYKQTYLDTAITLSEIVKQRTRPLYILYTSSTSVYGDCQGREVDEQAPLLANTENGRILIETEKKYLDMQTDQVKVCVLRLAGIYGPGRELEKRARMMSSAKMSGADTPTNHISLTNIVRAIKWCYDLQLSGVYNLAEDFHPTKKELYNKLCEKHNLPTPIWQDTTQNNEKRNTACIVLNYKIKSTGFCFSKPDEFILQ